MFLKALLNWFEVVSGLIVNLSKLVWWLTFSFLWIFWVVKSILFPLLGLLLPLGAKDRDKTISTPILEKVQKCFVGSKFKYLSKGMVLNTLVGRQALLEKPIVLIFLFI